MFNGKTHYKWPFSIAMLQITSGIQRVHVFLSPCFGVSWFHIQFWESISVILMTLVTFKPYIYICIYASIPAFKCLYEYLYLSIYTHMCVYIYICMCVYILKPCPPIEISWDDPPSLPPLKNTALLATLVDLNGFATLLLRWSPEIPLSIDHRYPSEESGWYTDMWIYLHIRVCMYVCMYVCKYVCKCVYVYV